MIIHHHDRTLNRCPYCKLHRVQTCTQVLFSFDYVPGVACGMRTVVHSGTRERERDTRRRVMYSKGKSRLFPQRCNDVSTRCFPPFMQMADSVRFPGPKTDCEGSSVVRGSHKWFTFHVTYHILVTALSRAEDKGTSNQYQKPWM